MTWEAGSTDHQRLRAGYAVLSIGMMILLFAWTMAVLRGPQGQGEMAVRHEKLDPPSPDQILPAIGMAMILTGGCLLTVLVISVFAFIRMRRRFRDHIFAPPRKTTPMADIWRMHKVPDIPDDPVESDEAEKP